MHKELIRGRRARKKEKRNRKLRKRKIGSSSGKQSQLYQFYYNYEKRLLKDHKSKLITFFEKLYGINNDPVATFKIPKLFSLKKNYDQSLNIIIEVNRAIDYYKGSLVLPTLDFTDCEFVDIPALLLLQVSKRELTVDLQKLNNKLKAIKINSATKVVPSNNEEVNKLLVLNRFLDPNEIKTELKGLVPISTMGFVHGRKKQKSFIENRKGPVTTRFVAYINECLQNFGHELSPEGISKIESIVAEVLNNSEDHSPFDSWYLTANYSHNVSTPEDIGSIGEINIAIFNFGSSIYEGLVETKEENSEMFNTLLKQHQDHKKKCKKNATDEEQYLTLLALQEGVSRLKFKDYSRGTGTMTFIQAFMAIGDFEDSEHIPSLHLMSGNSHIIVSRKYQPYINESDRARLSFNNSNNLIDRQDGNNLKRLNLIFPGTMLNAKIFLNENYLSKKRKESEL